MIKRIICFFKGHSYNFYGRCSCGEYEPKKPKAEFNCIYDANDEKAINSHLDQIFEKHHG